MLRAASIYHTSRPVHLVIIIKQGEIEGDVVVRMESYRLTPQYYDVERELTPHCPATIMANNLGFTVRIGGVSMRRMHS